MLDLLSNTAIKNDGSVECSAEINSMATQANDTGQTLFIPAGIYKVKDEIIFRNIIVEAEFGSIFEHHPVDHLTDCVRIIGSKAGRSKLKNLTLKRAAGNTFGQDLLRVEKGDYVTLEDVYVENSKRDGVHVVAGGSFDWIENLVMHNVKVQDAGRDGFGFTIVSGTGEQERFINQVDMIECETRSAKRHALRMENLNTGNNAIKMSNFRFMNCEFHAAPSVYDLIRIKGQPASGNSACIENLSFYNCAVEETSQGRRGRAIHISGRMQGKFEFKNSIMFGVIVPAPTVTQSANSGSTLAPDTYYVSYAWVMDTGEIGARSSQATITVASGNQLNVTLPAFPTGAVSANIYLSTISNEGRLQGNTTTTMYTQSTPYDPNGGEQSKETDILGFDNFPFYEYEDISSPTVPLYKSHIGIWKRHVTKSLAPETSEDTISIGANEIVEGWVFNGSGCFARFTVMNGTYLYVHDDVKCTISLVGGVIRLTNNDTANRTLNLHLQRITKN